ncbi:MAG: hypothetical protein ACHBMF_01275 [Chromatiales bacterium]
MRSQSLRQTTHGLLGAVFAPWRDGYNNVSKKYGIAYRYKLGYPSYTQ